MPPADDVPENASVAIHGSLVEQKLLTDDLGELVALPHGFASRVVKDFPAA
ncbi:hypothetical protein [Hyphomicrobium sp.]|uniref:hypothetical protein n=1 Tax=Hyphomicrobium sp. TaxID=82 RepID=UPI0025C41BDD|nr:hypothetical protein [Hyphomicrobium sp.]